VLHQVGVGALGPVFRTYEPTRDRLVAVKVFRLDVTPEQAQSLADELSSATEAGLFHPSIVEPVAAGVEGSSAYRADEYVAAETLDVAMRHYAPAPIEKVLPFITQLAGAIDFARSAAVGHGALHPRDVFVTPEEARAGGFGIVEALERVGLRAPVRRPYTAPERIAGGKWGIGADVFSLAVIAYELLSGRRPSGTGPQIAPLTGGQHAAAIHSIIVRAMSEDPERRHPSALAFASDLDAASRGETSFQPVVAVPGAAAATAGPPTDVEDAVADMPPPAAVDERAEPVEAEHEEAAFRASEPELDDIAAAAGGDAEEAGFPSEQEYAVHPRRDAAVGASLFHEEDGGDLAIEAPVRQDSARFMDEFVEPPDRQERRSGPPEVRAHPVPSLLSHDDDDEREPLRPPAILPLGADGEPPAVIRETRGIGIVPWAVTIALALLVGFAAGYSVRGRVPAATEPASDVTAATNAPQSSSEKPAPQSYSEQAVTPSQPPPPAGDAPLTSRDLPSAGSPSAPPASSSAPSAPRGSIEVRSTPSKAGVTLDGTWRGRTPLTIDDVRLGQHVVRVVEPGYVTAREEITLSERTPSRELSIKLQRAPSTPPQRPASRATLPESRRPESYTGTIYVDSRPRGAQVIVDGKFMGTTPIRIPEVRIGSHVVRLRLEDHRDWTASTRVSSGQESRVTGSLERIR
jgi:serine/threonine-protein kinase